MNKYLVEYTIKAALERGSAWDVSALKRMIKEAVEFDRINAPKRAAKKAARIENAKLDAISELEYQLELAVERGDKKVALALNSLIQNKKGE